MEVVASSSPFMNASEDEELFLGEQVERPRSNSAKPWFWPICTLSFIVFASLMWILGNTSNRSTQRNDMINENLTPPNLVHRPDLKNLHYCGFDPANSESFPHIPPVTDKTYELVLVQGFIRHGDRFFDSGSLCWPGQQNVTYECQMSEISLPGTKFSDSSIPNPARVYRKRFMTNRNDFEGNCMVGQLSEKGYHQERALGTIFRKAYVGGLLNPSLNNSEVFFRSDDVPRTVMSAEAFISGMYPDNQAHNADASIVDIWTMDFDRETEISNPHDCPGLTDNVFKARHSEEYRNHIETFTAPLRERLSPVIGIPKETITDSQFDCSYVSACRGTPLPESLSLDIFRALEQDALFKFYYPLQFPNRIDGARLAAGPLIREIYERMNQVIDARSKMIGSQVESPYIKFSLYSGHDTGPIMLILSAFGLEDDLWAPYASYISLELYQSVISHEYSVRLIYNGKALKFPYLHDESQVLPFSLFKTAVLPIIPSREDCPDIYSR